MRKWMDEYYPVRTVTTTSREPAFVTPDIKHLLRRKSRLMHAGRIEEASAVAARIGIAIAKANRRELNDVNSSLGTKALWQRVNKIIENPNESESGSKVTSEELNSHYANISTDSSYVPPGKALQLIPMCHLSQRCSRCFRSLTA